MATKSPRNETFRAGNFEPLIDAEIQSGKWRTKSEFYKYLIKRYFAGNISDELELRVQLLGRAIDKSTNETMKLLLDLFVEDIEKRAKDRRRKA